MRRQGVFSRSNRFKTGVAVAAVSLLILMTSQAVWAQMQPQAPGFNPNNQPGANQPQNQSHKQIQDEATKLASQFGVRVLVESDLALPAGRTLTPIGNPSSIEAGLNALSQQIEGAAWKKIYLPDAVSSTPPNPDQLAQMVRALNSMEATGLVMADSTSSRATSFVKNFPVTEGFEQSLAAEQFSTKPIYLLYQTKPGLIGTGASDATIKKFNQLQKEQLDMMMQMTPQQMQQAMQAGMQSFMQLDPQVRNQLMGNWMRMGFQMLRQMSPDQRRQLFQSVWQGMPNHHWRQ